MISKGYLYHLVWVKDFILESPTLESVTVVCEFPELFLEDLPGVPPEREINFGLISFQIPILFLFFIIEWIQQSLRN